MAEAVSFAAFIADPPVSSKIHGRREDQGGVCLGKENRQAYVNSLATQVMAESLGEQPGALYNPKTPNLVVQHEKPEHRLVMLYKLQGLSNREIARRTGYSEPWLSQLCRQPWFLAKLTEMLTEAKGEVIDEIVRVEATNSIFKLVDLRDHAKSEQVQFSSAVRILEQHMGKPVQRVESNTTTHIFQVSAQLEDIQKQLDDIEIEERALKLLPSVPVEATSSRIENVQPGPAGTPS